MVFRACAILLHSILRWKDTPAELKSQRWFEFIHNRLVAREVITVRVQQSEWTPQRWHTLPYSRYRLDQRKRSRIGSPRVARSLNLA